MNTIQTPVVSAITLAFGNAVSKGQLNFAAAIAIEVRESFLDEKSKFKFSEYARKVEQASGGNISERTVKNCAVLAKALILKYAAAMVDYDQTEADVLAFSNFVAEQVAPTTYRTTLDDLVAFCAGTPSVADKRAQLLQAAVDAEAAKLAKQAEAQDQQQTNVDQQLQTVQKTAEDAVAAQAKAEQEAEEAKVAAAKAETEKQEAIKRGQAIAEAEQKKAVEAQEELARVKALADEAELARKEQESFVLKVGVNLDGTPNITVQQNPNPAFLEQVAKELKAMAKALRQQQSTAMGDAFKKAA
jgi:hypothetical protein